MATRAEQITAALFDLLNTPSPLASGNVWRSRLQPIPDGTNVAIVLRQQADTRLGDSTLSRNFRQLLVVLEVYARGDIPDNLADSTIESVMSRFMADRNLGDLCDDITVGDKSLHWESRETDLVVIDLNFLINYEVNNTDL